eukprot:6616470-Prymnesium_polylepis.1
MHAHSGTERITCLDRTPSIGTRVLSSVSAVRGCSFALGVHHVCGVAITKHCTQSASAAPGRRCSV